VNIGLFRFGLLVAKEVAEAVDAFSSTSSSNTKPKPDYSPLCCNCKIKMRPTNAAGQPAEFTCDSCGRIQDYK
jgi:hypothetical protein